MIVLISVIVASISIFNIAICDNPVCPGTPDGCSPIGGNTPKDACVKIFLNDTGSTWNEMQNVCQYKEGRLVWFRNDLTVQNLISMQHKATNVSLFVLDLLLSTVDEVGLFWKSPDNTSYECTSTETSECLTSSNERNCSAVGCCWRNNKCQYPNTQHLSVFNQSVENYNLSNSDDRQCVGYQLNNNSKNGGHWISYDCFKTLSNAAYFCEYKCNTTKWINTTVTDFNFTNNKTPTEKPKENGMNLESTSSRLINMLLALVLMIVVM